MVAFTNGLRRKDFVEELGRTRPKTIAKMMYITNGWADDEDAVSNKRARSPDDDRFRCSNDHKRRGGRNYEDYDGPKKVTVGFINRDDGKGEYHGSGYRNSNRD
jgi:hypothetical protein